MTLTFFGITSTTTLGGPRTPEQDAQNAAVIAEATEGVLSISELFRKEDENQKIS